MSVITENNKDHLLNYEGVEQLLVKINDRFARTDRYATPDTIGMIRAEINTEVNSEDISTGDNYPVQITTDGNAFVNIDIPTSLPANGGNADTVDGKHASDFAVANHNHTISVTSTFIPNITSSYNDGVLTIFGATTNVEYTGITDVENTNTNP